MSWELLRTTAPRAMASPSLVVRHTLARSPGHSLDAVTGRFMQSRLGRDFSRVRVHSDSAAASAARVFGARAFTRGSDIFFDSGEYRPQTQAGRRVLAHELTHVIQQEGAAPGATQTAPNRPDGAEQDALRTSEAVVNGGAAGQSHPVAPLTIQRLPRGDDDPIHRPLIERYRMQHGLPRGGVDESGMRVGPSDAQIKYGHRTFTTQVTVPGPPASTVPAAQAAAVARQVAPAQVAVDTERPPAPPAQATPTPTPAFQPLARERVRFGLDATGPTFSASAVARHMDAFRFRFFGRPVDVGHEPGATAGVTTNSSGTGVLYAGIGGTLLNAHFAAFGYDFLELGLAQGGISIDSTGGLTISGGAAAEIHTPDPRLSFVVSTGGSITREPNGSITTQWTPLSLTLVVHILNP